MDGPPRQGIYAGPSAASEPETTGLENLLSGMVPLTSDLNGTVLLNYHTFGEAVIYPQGYLESTPVGGTTPACRTFDGSNCLPADMLALSSNTARPRWTKAVFNPPGGASPTLSASINGVPTTMDKYREGALYTLYKFDNPGTGLCVPRSFQYGENAADGEGIGCTDLCDPSRVPVSGWSHRSGSRGGSLDCWYEPNPSVGATLTLPGGPTASATHCTLMFSLDIPVFSEGDRLVLERADGTGGWDVIRFWPTDDDYGNDATGTFPFVLQVHSYVVELPVDPLPAHRFRVDGVGSSSGVGSVDLFDPLIYCRYGPLR